MTPEESFIVADENDNDSQSKVYPIYYIVCICFISVVDYAEDMSVNMHIISVFKLPLEGFQPTLLVEKVSRLLITTSRIGEEEKIMSKLVSIFGRLQHSSFYRSKG